MNYRCCYAKYLLIKNKNKMKIFEFIWSDLKEWVYASDSDVAIAFYLDLRGNVDIDKCVVCTLPEDQWTEHFTYDASTFDEGQIDNEEDYFDGHKILGTFKDLVENETDTMLVASTQN